MTIGYADLEFGLVWDETQQSFDVSLRYTGQNNVDRSLHPPGAVEIDLDKLAGLADDGPAYADALTDRVFALPDVRRFVADAMTATGSVPLHFRLQTADAALVLGTRYDLAPGQVLNLDSTQVIRHGDGPSGAHSDICHPAVADAVWQAVAEGDRAIAAEGV